MAEQKKIYYRTRKSCTECRSRIISNHFGKFKCHDCGFCITYDTRTGDQIKDALIRWF